MDEPTFLIADRVCYFHQSDEAMFFAWLDRMDVVSGYEGRGDGLHILLARRPTDSDLRELLAFHQRYSIDMRQLAMFKTPANASWFAAPGMYWHERVFGESYSETVEIHDLNDRGVLSFDLRDLLRVLKPSSLRANWTIATPAESAFEATGDGGLQLENLAADSSQISGEELLVIADNTQQVIWGDFIGVLPDDPQQEWMTIRAFDSSFYEITTFDEASLAKIKSRFHDVRITHEANAKLPVA